MNGKKIVTFGELLLRFSKPGQLRLTQGDLFTCKYGGSEANVAVSLATQGENVTYITRLPDTPVGHAGAMNLAQLGVDTSCVLYGGQRIGTYYFEPAAGMRAAKVIYDRSGSAYYDLKPGMIPWREILKDCDYFHVSGITAAISPQAADATFEALDIADDLGVTVCFDINYRKNLWKYEGAAPRETLSRMLSRCDMMFGDAIEFEWLSQHKQPPFTATDSNFEMQMKEYGEWFDTEALDDGHAKHSQLKPSYTHSPVVDRWQTATGSYHRHPRCSRPCWCRRCLYGRMVACHQSLSRRQAETVELFVGCSSLEKHHPW